MFLFVCEYDLGHIGSKIQSVKKLTIIIGIYKNGFLKSVFSIWSHLFQRSNRP